MTDSDEAREIPRDAIETRRLSIAFARASLAIRSFALGYVARPPGSGRHSYTFMISFLRRAKPFATASARERAPSFRNKDSM